MIGRPMQPAAAPDASRGVGAPAPNRSAADLGEQTWQRARG